MDDEEYNEIFIKFLNNCGEKVINFQDSVAKGKICFVIENPAMRYMLENKLKNAVKNTLDYHLNQEKVEIEIKDFIKMLSKEYENLENKAELKAAEKNLKNKLLEMNIKNFCKNFKNIVKDSFEFLASALSIFLSIK